MESKVCRTCQQELPVTAFPVRKDTGRRRTARRIAARALKVVKADLDKVNIENPELASLLIHQLQEIAAKGLETGQLGSSVAALRELSTMVGIGMHNRRTPHHQYRC